MKRYKVELMHRPTNSLVNSKFIDKSYGLIKSKKLFFHIFNKYSARYVEAFYFQLVCVSGEGEKIRKQVILKLN